MRSKIYHTILNYYNTKLFNASLKPSLSTLQAGSLIFFTILNTLIVLPDLHHRVRIQIVYKLYSYSMIYTSLKEYVTARWKILITRLTCCCILLSKGAQVWFLLSYRDYEGARI